MATANYDACLSHLLIHEGGYTNHPADPGGPTNFGITIADYRRYVKASATAADVRAMKVEEAKAIYRTKYWDAMRCDDLPAGIDNSIFDYGVNSGIGRAGKVLRRLVGLSDTTSTITDEVVTETAQRDAKALIAAINTERLQFLRSLKTWSMFGAGWSGRVAEVQAFSLSLATQPATTGSSGTSIAAPPPAVATDAPSAKGALPAPTIAPTAGPAVGIAAGAALLPFLHEHPFAVIAGLATIAVGVAAAIVMVRRRHKARQEAAASSPVVIPPAA